MEDSQIIQLFLSRQEAAIEELNQKYFYYCHQIAWNILKNEEDVAECINDTWLEVWNSIPPKEPAVLSAYVGRIVRNNAIDELRRRCASRRMDSHMAVLKEEIAKLDYIAVNSIENHIAEKELLETINRFLKNMSPKDRDIFIRRYWYMDSIKEIAKCHGISTSSVKSNLFRSRKKLAKRLDFNV